MRIKLLGKLWDLVVVPRQAAEGQCDAPSVRSKQIRIARRCRGQHRLDVILHELLHAAAFHQFDEQWVDELATDMARVLWRLGYRDNDDEDSKIK